MWIRKLGTDFCLSNQRADLRNDTRWHATRSRWSTSRPVLRTSRRKMDYQANYTGRRFTLLSATRPDSSKWKSHRLFERCGGERSKQKEEILVIGCWTFGETIQSLCRFALEDARFSTVGENITNRSIGAPIHHWEVVIVIHVLCRRQRCMLHQRFCYFIIGFILIRYTERNLALEFWAWRSHPIAIHTWFYLCYVRFKMILCYSEISPIDWSR